MKYSDVGFRAVYHSFVMIKNDKGALRAIADFPGAQDANAVLTYGYYDREQGITLEVLGAAIAGEGDGSGSGLFIQDASAPNKSSRESSNAIFLFIIFTSESMEHGFFVTKRLYLKRKLYSTRLNS